MGKDCSTEVQTTAALRHQSIVISGVVGDRAGKGVASGAGSCWTTGGRQQVTEASFTLLLSHILKEFLFFFRVKGSRLRLSFLAVPLRVLTWLPGSRLRLIWLSRCALIFTSAAVNSSRVGARLLAELCVMLVSHVSFLFPTHFYLEMIFNWGPPSDVHAAAHERRWYDSHSTNGQQFSFFSPRCFIQFSFLSRAYVRACVLNMCCQAIKQE